MISPKEVEKQFNRAKKLGWLPFFEEAANTVTKGYFDAADLMGIASRETNLDPVWLTKAGDGGHGYGLMQADIRSFPEWIKTEQWKDARESIIMGATVLMQKWQDVQSGIGVKRAVKSSRSGQSYSFLGKDVGQGKEAQAVTIAAYNNGLWPHYAVTNNQDVDTYTTGGNYSADVMLRAILFRKLITPPDTQTPAGNPVLPTNEPPIDPTAPAPVAVAAVTAEVPKGDPVDAEPVKVSRNGALANWLFTGGGLMGLGTAVWGFVQSNLNAVGIGIICVTVLILAIIFRGAITDAIRMNTAADPDKRNVK